MCRFLMMRGREPFAPAAILDAFRARCRDSREYQGHGWGAAWRTMGVWSRYRSLTPIWEDAPALPAEVDFLVVHARSAFRDEGIAIENNMPFYRRERVFVFNGELRGVRLRVPGRIGAEKVFHLIDERDEGDLDEAVAAADALLVSKSARVRAMNLALTDGDRIYASCRYTEMPDYFTLHYREGDVAAVCSEPLDPYYEPMASGERRVL
jgi:glutamine amidotransferase